MNRIEDDLKAALRRKPAPPGFAAKVSERIENKALSKRAPRRIFGNPLWMAAAAMILITIGAGVVEYQGHVRARNEAALNRTLTALSIAAVRLDEVEKKAFAPERWERIGRQLTDVQPDADK